MIHDRSSTTACRRRVGQRTRGVGVYQYLATVFCSSPSSSSSSAPRAAAAGILSLRYSRSAAAPSRRRLRIIRSSDPLPGVFSDPNWSVPAARRASAAARRRRSTPPAARSPPRGPPRILLSATTVRSHAARSRTPPSRSLEASAFPPEFLQRLHHRREYSRARRRRVRRARRTGRGRRRTRSRRTNSGWRRDRVPGFAPRRARTVAKVRSGRWGAAIARVGTRRVEGCKSRASRDVVGASESPSGFSRAVDVGDDGGGVRHASAGTSRRPFPRDADTMRGPRPRRTPRRARRVRRRARNRRRRAEEPASAVAARGSFERRCSMRSRVGPVTTPWRRLSGFPSSISRRDRGTGRARGPPHDVISRRVEET